ncbi:hypothetical protein CORC01_04831 [Colletotrichum orchidophilum]|uniref:Uncharacterized protein n=1 Tax=Colletotrichum orchidophilum TaxID=1209926 RepID=A0A1G4BEY5_9PEZI|nr:uncharacterized protein CORC01_04831 [Colletotrichum orchidophilum]OHE99930.1 hypothetical protein CORC01_04831 [Colletotrichum orchidophilum]
MVNPGRSVATDDEPLQNALLGDVEPPLARNVSPSTIDACSVASAYGLSGEINQDPGFSIRGQSQSQLYDSSTSPLAGRSKKVHEETWGVGNDGSDVAHPLIHILQDHKSHAETTFETSDGNSDSEEVLKETSTQSSFRRVLWTPPWLRKISLLGFVSLFTVLWIALVVLAQYDVENSGFVIQASASRFSWTYGPTAVFVAITGLWKQVDYHSKMHEPWQQMAKGPSPASNSLLLDYVSPILPTGLTRSFRNRHWTVAAAITGSAVLGLATLLSTTLMVPVATRISGPVPVQLNSAFDGSAFWKTTAWTLSNRTVSTVAGQFTYSDHSFSNISAISATQYLQLLQGQISEPVGTQEGVVFQDISISKTPEIRDVEQISTVVDSIIPNITCEEVDITVFDEMDGNITQFSGTVEVHIPSCGNPRIELSICADGTDQCVRNLTTYNVYRAYCSDSGIPDGFQTEARLLLMASNITQGDKPGSQYYDFDHTTRVANMTAISCQVAYMMAKNTVTTDFEKNETQLHLSESPNTGRRLPNLSDRQLVELLYSVLVAADAEMDGPRRDFGNDARKYTWGNSTAGSAGAFELMSHTIQDASAGYFRFFDVETMATSATTVLTQLAVLFLKDSFLVGPSETVSAQGTYTQERLRFRPLSLWIVVVCLIVLGLLALSIIFTFSPSVSQDPSLLASYAAILARSASVDTILAPLGECRTSQISYELVGHRFSTEFDGSTFKIQPHEVIRAHEGLIPEPKRKQHSWIPMTARTYFMVAAFILPMVTIIALEIAYRQAVEHDGFAMQNTFWTLYGTQYSSALVMLAIANIFHSLDFTITTFSTFSLMRSRAVPSHQGITSNPMREIKPVALLKALRRGHIGLSSSTLAALIGSFLTIIVSNLWVEIVFTTKTNFKTQLTTTWNLEWANSAVDDGGAVTILENVRLNKTQSPDSAVWGDLVFPLFDAIAPRDDQHGALNLGISSQKLNISIEVPSLRPKLVCHDAAKVDKAESSSGTSMDTTITATDPLPQACIAGVNGRDKNVSFEGTGDATDGFMALLFDLDIGNTVSKHCSPCETTPDSTRPDNPMGCPSLGIFFGEHALVCAQVIQQVQVGLEFTSSIGKNGEVVFHRSSLTSTPTPIESTAVNLTRGDSNLDLFPYRIQPHFDQNLTNPVSDDAADPFFRYILSGTTGISRGDLVKNTDQLIDAINGLYTKFMVQVMDSNIFRRPVVPSTPASQQDQRGFVNGTVSMEESRLTMNYIPKLILQIFLGAMMIFGLAAYILVDLKGTLPRSPHSIASGMALFAGSELCSIHIPENAEWMDKRQLDRLFEGYAFALGWWSRSATEADARSIDSLLDAPVADERFGIDVGTPERLGFQVKGNTTGRRWSKWSAL